MDKNIAALLREDAKTVHVIFDVADVSDANFDAVALVDDDSVQTAYDALPAADAPQDRTVPALANLVADFVAAGWPKGKEPAAV